MTSPSSSRRGTAVGLVAPEARLVLACAGGDDVAEIVARAGPHLDWDLVLTLAQRESVAPLLLERLSAVHGSIPDRALDRLRAFARVTEFRMLYLEQRVAESVRALASVGIDGVLLKGAALASAAYGSFVRRPMVDFDLLVRPSDAQRALNALLSVGWMWQQSRDRHADYGHLHHLPALYDARGVEITLELHTALLPAGQPFRLEADDVLADATTLPSGARVPSVHHMLLHACVHFAWAHMLRKGAVRAFRDVRMLLELHDIEPRAFAAAAATARATTACYWTLRLASSLAAVPVPPELLAALRPTTPEWVLASCERHFALVLLPDLGGGCPSTRMRRLVWSVAMRPARSGHGASRPWDVLSLRAEDRERRAAEGRLRGELAVERTRGWWLQYGRAVLLSSRRTRRAA